MEQLTTLAINFLALSAEASPWLLLGLLIAGLMKAWVPSQMLTKHLGSGKGAIVKAALIGAPLPLCSCGVIPVAAELRRSGASASATSSFLVSTPETGIDSVSVSYALLGPIFAIYRPFAAIMSAIMTGLLVATVKEENVKFPHAHSKATSCCGSKETDKEDNLSVEKVMTEDSKKSSCCSSKKVDNVESAPHSNHEHSHHEHSAPQKTTTSCCASETTAVTKKDNAFINKTKQGVYYASTKLIDDIIIWLLVGLIFASLIRTFLPQEFLLSYGSGLPAMLLMIVISIPMYICATASTPIAAGFIMAGLSPGTALVFMMAGPATNISTLGVIRNEMGSAVLIRYLLGVSISAISFALLLDFVLNFYDINITDQMQHSHEVLPQWFGLACAGLIAFLSIKPLRRLLIK
ncbi:SO_0444 family Cu/Zn efflux transporter [Colwellia sp. E2M01]|uniref:SO_0444 family Cu/Zn efflux transporter n=1 Tax=Colwellia sp. E2M01 TaxID=2841561 RepID=UPI001C0902C5|nr:SO_0444 family Cu/Zn efflux transporter [Colwellia sp. E2M01]MBU2870022.1 SO_0444 family Cu/Zn efflux transporter [Colwellia sp. E2M01]